MGESVKKSRIMYFSATWCKPCKEQAPIMKELGQLYPITYIDIDDDPNDYTSKFKVSAVPTILIVNDDKELARQEGTIELEDLKEIIEQYDIDKT